MKSNTSDIKYRCKKRDDVVTGAECYRCYYLMNEQFRGLNKIPASRALCVQKNAERVAD